MGKALLLHDWKEIILTASEKLNLLNNDKASLKLNPDKWSIKEIIGHLCDSAMNNYSRVINMQLATPNYEIERYAQNDWVRLAGYQSRDWNSIKDQWLLLNLAFMKLVENTPEHSFANLAKFENKELSLEFIIVDYVDHLKHHLNQIYELV